MLRNISDIQQHHGHDILDSVMLMISFLCRDTTHLHANVALLATVQVGGEQVGLFPRGLRLLLRRLLPLQVVQLGIQTFHARMDCAGQLPRLVLKRALFLSCRALLQLQHPRCMMLFMLFLPF